MRFDPIALFKKLISRPAKTSVRQDVDVIFRQFVATGNSKRDTYAFEHPVLLSPSRLTEIVENSSDVADPSSDNARAIARLQALIGEIENNSARYPFGSGPVERILSRHHANDITLETAVQEAKKHLSGLLSPIYVMVVSHLAQDLAQSADWRLAVQLMTVMFGAVDHSESDIEGFKMRVDATLAWLDIVARATAHVPDGSLYEDALKRGAWLADEADKRGNRTLRSEALHRMGVLNLDPYILGKSITNYMSDIQDWKVRQDNEWQSRISFGFKHMPEPVEALQLAEHYLSTAAEMRSGFGLARSMKALAQVRYWLAIARNERDELVLGPLVEALKSSGTHLEHVRAIMKASDVPSVRIDADLSELGVNVQPERDEDIVARFLAERPEEIRSKESDIFTLLLKIIEVTHTLANDEAAVAMLVWEQAIRVAILPPPQQLLLKMLYDEGLLLLRNLYAADRLELTAADSSTKQTIETEAARIALLPDWDKGTIALAIFAMLAGQEELALRLVEPPELRAGSAWTRHQELTRYLTAVSYIGAAVNAYDAGSYGTAMSLYLCCVMSLALLQLRDLALHMWRRVADVAGKVSSSDLSRIKVEVLTSTFALAESYLGPAAGFIGREAIRKLLGGMKDQELFAQDAEAFQEVHFDLFRASNGIRFAALLRGTHEYDWRNDAKAISLLNRVNEALDKEPEDRRSALQGEMLMASYLGEAEQKQGATEADILANLMRAYDDHVNGKLYESSDDESSDDDPVPTRGSWSELANHLGQKTVLIAYAVSLLGDEVRLDSTIIAPKDIKFTDQVVGDTNELRDFTMSAAGLRGHLDHFGILAMAARMGLLKEPPRTSMVSKAGRRGLEHLSKLCIGERVTHLLSELSDKGYTHLCVVPIGSLHFLPFHLLNFGRGLLADKWTVTYLPSVELLLRNNGGTRRRNEVLTSFGVTFGGESKSKLSTIKEAAKEADEVASIFGSKARVDDRPGLEASKGAILSALSESQMVHIATHGRHNAYAPSFQCLYAAPQTAKQRSDATIYAYELFGMDLAGLELVTLSACETALGRVDISGNLRGLPANLLLQGARTIVGTLWEVESSAAQSFFTSFYSAMKQGMTKLDAFARAQSETRSHFPKYRDWGPFYLSGDWQGRIRMQPA